jgi:UDP-N-acetyl-2-amino-2-deoxyglucuronate dehydrogenase
METPFSASGSPALRFAIIGGGASIATTHIRAIQQLPNAQIAGMSDVDAERGAASAQAAGCPFFVDHRALLAALRPDVAVICAPHPFHATLALDSFAEGAHVLVEKPIAVTVAEADQMIAAAADAGRILAVNFQQRFRPVIERARGLIAAGEVGSLVRVLCVEPWFRTAAYYRSATWRGTWRGEGGGVLMNQAPHSLDLLCYLAGMPVKVWGWTRTLHHAIETEDSAQAMLEYANGAPGYLNMSTVEAGASRLQIVGERAGLELMSGNLTITHFTPAMIDQLRDSPQPFEAPQETTETITLPGDGGGHLAVYRDLAAAITSGARPRSDGLEGRQSLELANAIIFSSYAERAVELPLDRAAYDALLAKLRQGEREKTSDAIL